MKRKIALFLTICLVFCSFTTLGVNANADIYNDTFISPINNVEYFAHSIIVKTYEPMDTSIYSKESPEDFCGIKAVGVYGWDETYYEQYGYMKYIVELEEETTFSQAAEVLRSHSNVFRCYLRKAKRTPDGTLINDKVLVPNSNDNTFVKDGREYFLHELYIQSYELIEDSTIYTEETPNDFFGVKAVKVSAYEDHFEENGYANYLITLEDSVDILNAVDILSQNEKIKSTHLIRPDHPAGGDILPDIPEGTEILDNEPEDTERFDGDINGNDKIDMTDYILLKRAYFGTYTLDDAQKSLADINQNDKIDMTDYILLKRIYFGTYTL